LAINQHAISAGFIFPFITSISPQASDSQIQLESEAINHVVYNGFRKFAFLESDTYFPNLDQEIKNVPADFFDRDTEIFASMWKVLLSSKFPALMY
jgi:hypothetical protein